VDNLQFIVPRTKSCDMRLEPSEMAHYEELAQTMRQDDRNEVYANSGLNPFEALAAAHNTSKYAVTLFINDKLAACFGIRPHNDEWAVPWLLGTDAIYEHPFHYMRFSVNILGAFLSVWPNLINMMDARNEKGLKWARMVGFEIMESVPHGYLNMPFHPIVLRRPVNV
jgi:hypothetical protein